VAPPVIDDDLTSFVLASSTNNPKLSPVVGSWSKRGALLIVLVVGMYSPTVVDCSSWAPQR
jgi:hypothetical protein